MPLFRKKTEKQLPSGQPKNLVKKGSSSQILNESEISETAIINAASSGRLDLLKQYDSNKVDFNTGDYDQRTPLHLAASEGHLEVVKWLVEEKKVDINIKDRWRGTPLSDAIRHKHDDVAKYLQEKGGKTFLNKTDLSLQLCQAASEGNIEEMKRLIQIGADHSSGDYDQRTPLHLAASEGKIEVVQYLLEQGVKVDVEDRWGSTPIQDASRHGHEKIVLLLKSKGARIVDAQNLKSLPEFTSSLQRAVSLLCDRGKWIYGAALIPEKDGIRFSDAWYGAEEFVNLLALYRKESESQSMSNVGEGKGLAGRVLKEKKPEWIEDVSSNNYQDFFNKDIAKTIGFKAGLGVPVLYENQVLAILIFRDIKSREKEEKEVEYFLDVAGRLIIAGLLAASGANSSNTKSFAKGIYREQQSVVYDLILQKGIFSSSILLSEVDWFYNQLGINTYYFEHFPPHLIANHIHSLIAAKKLAEATGEIENISLRTENEKDGTAFYICPANIERQIKIEQLIESKFLGEGYTSGDKQLATSVNAARSVRHFLTKGSVSASSSTQLHLYFVDTHSFIESDVSEKETDIWKISSGIFIRDKKVEARDRYQTVIKKAVDQLGPVVETYPQEEETVVMLGYRKRTTHSYFSTLTQIFEHNKIPVSRKFLETFSNGIAVCSFYVNCKDQNILQDIINEAVFMYILPRTSLTPLWSSRVLNAKEVVYAFAGWKFAFHFMNRQSEEYLTLYNKLKGNEEIGPHLLQLKKKLKSEVESEARIQETILNHPDVIKDLYQEFEEYNDPKKSKSMPSTIRRKDGNSDLKERIRGIAETDLDAHILESFLIFNSVILRTNFFKQNKLALSFRLHPSFLKDADFPTIPFAVYFFLGSDFRGFHVRFSDIARGGIRMILSRNQTAFQQNVQTVFQENYNLAWTQQKKNKDIPEGGSKGTILLSFEHQDKADFAFQKYIDSMLDLLMPNHEIKDNLGRDEYIFCGPDEGTAGYMDWAALHAKSRGYRFWSAFTTGKSQSLGGIPHDEFGMTTRSVHQFVLGTLEKVGQKEENITKFQTGGPDGDLGSNEIKISKDKTLGIVDGSGVLYDPEGINRAEMTRLAEFRKMVKEFDQKKISKNGFLVLIDEKNRTLPDGTFIESGLAFRNSFHLSKYFVGDLFVPCGGRPEAVNINNVKNMFIENPDGTKTPKFKYIIEGANLFFTKEARSVLEQSGVVLFKDASANKGGVTSSSMEVLAALALEEKDFQEHMQVKNGVIPQFYKDYVVTVQKIIESNARMEFDAIWAEHQLTKKHRATLTDLISDKINELSTSLEESDELWNIKDVRERVLKVAVPKILMDKVGFEKFMERVPPNYLKAIFSSFLASRYVYENGLTASPEFAFYKFLRNFTQK